jgi:hypothetical protein
VVVDTCDEANEYILNKDELMSKLSSVCHPFTEMIVHEDENINIQLISAIERRNAYAKEEPYDDFFGVEDKKSKLSAIRRHSFNNFEKLEGLLDTGVYCPFCFVFRGWKHKLIPIWCTVV